jgi:hypothetical protein
MRIFSKHWLLIIITIFLIFLRFYQIPDRFIFDIDVQYQALLAWEQVKNFHPIWIGVSASNLGYYLGPGIVYVTAMLLKISNGDPIILGYFASLIGVSTSILFFFILKKLFNYKVAIIGLILNTFSYFVVFYDRHYWPFAIPLISLLIYFSLVSSWKNKNWLYLGIFLMALSHHIHMSLFIFWPFYLINIFLLKKRLNLKNYLVGGAIYLCVISPLIVFDFNHNFDNLLFPIRYLLNYNPGTGSGLPTLSFLSNITSSFISFRSNGTVLGLFLIFFILAFSFYKLKNFRNINIAERYLFLVLAALISIIAIYPGPLQEYYGVILVPFLFMAFSLFLSNLNKVFLSLLLLFFVFQNTNYFFRDSYVGLSEKREIILNIKNEIGNEPFYLDFNSDRDFEGWRYLFQAYGITPSYSKSDEMFGWIYNKEDKEAPKILIYISNNLKISNNEGVKEIKTKNFKAEITSL